MPKRDNASAARRSSPGASPIGAEPAHSAGATSDVPFTSFSDTQWQAIRAIRDDWPSNIDWPEVRRQIEEAGREYSAVEHQREQRRRSAAYKTALYSARRSIIGLQFNLSRLEALAPSDLVGLPIPDLKKFEKRFKELDARYQTWSAPFSGRKSWIRERLINRLLTIWKKHLRGRLRTSKTKFQEPTGPLVRYLTLTLTAIQGESPGRHGIKSIVDKAKKRRRGNSGKPKKTGKKLRQIRQ
ncbi:hypothetical protein [Bradyrhizobium sp. 144]|uniref:hypothetical protein n=1 Tax=Bradyrhizobium sp. 144 TaxID=2782620 RepID=UPI001FF90ACF|nr:hypothetical protein [Bradyrhizobium sp. 144]MCK1699854.1 hypothetical protein [Bradyrhizobium sp. 144]